MRRDGGGISAVLIVGDGYERACAKRHFASNQIARRGCSNGYGGGRAWGKTVVLDPMYLAVQSDGAARNRQRDRSVLLDASAVAGHGDGIGPHRRAGSHRDGHGGVARARCRVSWLGLKLTVVPDGMPEADSVMALLKPLMPIVVIVDVP